jgi:hypothetical protein
VSSPDAKEPLKERERDCKRVIEAMRRNIAKDEVTVFKYKSFLKLNVKMRAKNNINSERFKQ